MAKIQNIGIGNYFRSPRGRNLAATNKIELLQVAANNGGSFLCYPVVGKQSTKVIVDTTRYYDIPVDTEVDPATP